jgi:hypothetical protein
LEALFLIFFNFHFLLGKLLNGFLRQVWDTKTNTALFLLVVVVRADKLFTLNALVMCPRCLTLLIDLRTYRKCQNLAWAKGGTRLGQKEVPWAKGGTRLGQKEVPWAKGGTRLGQKEVPVEIMTYLAYSSHHHSRE